MVRGSAQEEFLLQQQKAYPAELAEHPGRSVQLLALVNQGQADAALVDRLVFEQNQLVLGDIQAAFALDAEQPAAWAFARTQGQKPAAGGGAF